MAHGNLLGGLASHGVVVIESKGNMMKTNTEPASLIPHGVYSAINSYGKFFLFKVMDLQPDYASVIIYDRCFDERPENPSLEGLPIAVVHDSGWKTAPFVLSRFSRWPLKFVSEVPPTEEEQLIFTGWRELGGVEITPPASAHALWLAAPEEETVRRHCDCPWRMDFRPSGSTGRGWRLPSLRTRMGSQRDAGTGSKDVCRRSVAERVLRF